MYNMGIGLSIKRTLRNNNQRINSEVFTPSWRFQHLNSSRAKEVVRYAEFGGLENKIVLSNGIVDFYEVLGVDDDASQSEIKQAYRSLAKECHPDYLGDVGHKICLMLNEAYETLSDPEARHQYNQELQLALEDDDDGFTNEPLSEWAPTRNPENAQNEDPCETRAVFVDELTCIGCKNCIWCAPATFQTEQEHGRARVCAQWLNTEDEIQSAIDSCPVDCIHWVDKQELPALEWVTQKKTSRINIAVMMTGGAVDDIFDIADKFRRRREEVKRKQEQNRKVSAAQEAQRRQAAQEMIKNMGWFGGIVMSFVNVDAMLDNQHSSQDGVANGKSVGYRKRSKRYDQRMQVALSNGNSLGEIVPAERALVPIGVNAYNE